MCRKELVVAMDRNGARESGMVLDNDREGHRKLIRFATEKGARARFVLESTGVYGLDLAFALHRAKRVEVIVANPRAIAASGRLRCSARRRMRSTLR
jgi:transposase